MLFSYLLIYYRRIQYYWLGIQINSPRIAMKPNQLYQMKLRDEVYQEVFHKHLNLVFQINEIPVNEFQTVHTVFLPCMNKHVAYCRNYYIGHGFGGSSIMYFYLITDLLKKGNVILWQVRGMGFSTKLHTYQVEKIQSIVDFFLDGITTMLRFYNHTNSYMIGHSFSSYLILLFILLRQEQMKKYVKEVLLLSPVGVTSRYEMSCSNFFQSIYHDWIWCMNLNFKSPYTLLCSACCKDYFINATIIDEIELDQKQRLVMLVIVQIFIKLSNGSENLFFQLFQPNILPKIAIQPLLTKQPAIKITMAYGVDKDWADKTGATKLAQRFPSKIKKIEIEDVTHNIAFHTKTCRELFDFVLQ